MRAVPRGWRDGDVVMLAGAGAVTLNGSEYQAHFGEVGGPAAPLDLEAEAALIAFVWRNAARLSLAHDAAEGGLAVALAEAALWSGVGAALRLPDDAPRLFGEGGGQVVIACAPDDVASLEDVPLRRLGIVGGDTIMGLALEDLAAAWGAGD